MSSCWGFFDFVRWTFRAGVAAFFLISWCMTNTSALGQEDVDVQFGFEENDWSDPETLEFLTTPISQPGNSWGSEDLPDTYVQTGSSGDVIDAFIPGPQGVKSDDVVVLAFDSRYLSNSTNHSYLAFGSDEDLANAVFLGHGGGQFHVGTGTEFNLSGSTPTGVSIERSFDTNAGAAGGGTIANDSRIRVRLGFDVAEQAIRNFQVDSNSDGEFDTEFLAGDQAINLPDVDPIEWFLLTYAGRGDSRADNVSLSRQSTNGDYNDDLDFNEEDADILCAAISGGTDTFFDFNSDGEVDLLDINEFAFEHDSLPGDMNFDGATNFADFLILSGQFGKPATYSQGDITCNGMADFPDFLILSTSFGNSVVQQQQAQVFNAVPEPSTRHFAIAAIVCCVAATRRRK